MNWLQGLRETEESKVDIGPVSLKIMQYSMGIEKSKGGSMCMFRRWKIRVQLRTS